MIIAKEAKECIFLMAKTQNNSFMEINSRPSTCPKRDFTIHGH